MTETRIIDGTRVADALRERIRVHVEAGKAAGHATPGLAVVLVGADPASQVYVRSKHKRTQECGMASFEHILPAETGEDALLALINDLNRDPAVHGILVQLPLPRHIDSGRIIEAIDPAKDVDGFHPVNAGRLMTGGPALIPCTPLGCLYLLKSVHPRLDGLRAIVVGRSNIVGKPMAQLLLRESATVTMAHSRTRDLAGECRRADIIVAAAGQPELVRGDWISEGATVIDVGINRLTPPDGGKSRLIGDVAFAEAMGVAGAITPVPGGVGPMTIAMLMRNTLEACCRQTGRSFPDDL